MRLKKKLKYNKTQKRAIRWGSKLIEIQIGGYNQFLKGLVNF